MSSVLVKIALSMLAKLMTEKLFSKFFVIAGYNLSQRTSNKLDDEIIKSAAEALAVDYPPYKG